MTRKLKVLINSPHMDCKTARSRLVAAKEYHRLPLPHTNNFVFEAVSFISRVSLYLRDADDGIVNYLLSLFETTVYKTASLGTPQYKISLTPSLVKATIG